MIISKDLFLLGEQDYLRLPKDEKRRIKSSTNAAGNGSAGVAASAGGGGGGVAPGAINTSVGGGGGGGGAVVSTAAVIASAGMGKDPNDELRWVIYMDKGTGWGYWGLQKSGSNKNCYRQGLHIDR